MQSSLPDGLRFIEDGSSVYCDYCKKPLGTVHKKQVSEHVAGKRHKRLALSNKSSNEEVEIVETNANNSHKNVVIDKEAFLSSILSTKLSDEEDVESEQDSEPLMEQVTSDMRASGFAPLDFKPSGEVDNFFDSMPEEAERTGISKDIQSILKSNGTPNSKKPIAKDFDNSVAPTKLTLDTKPKSNENSSRLDDDKADDNPNAMPPWVIGSDAYHAIRHSDNNNLVLHYEIMEFSRFMSPTKAETVARERVAATVTNIVKTLWPKCEMKFFGSYATGLTLPTSDIDVCVSGLPAEGNQAELEQLARAVRNVKDFARKVHVINAKVSLVKLVSRDGNIQCDISIGHESGPRNVPIILSYIQQYPALRPLLMVVKCFLAQRSLNEVYTGGLGSYAVLLLVVSHLQMLSYNYPRVQANLGSVLIEFFHLYGRLFNLCVSGIAVKGDGSYYNKAQRYETRVSETMRFSLEDPNDLDNNIGANSFSVGRVRRAFSHAFGRLRSWRRDDPYSSVTPLSRILTGTKIMQDRRVLVIEDLQKRDVVNLARFIESSLPKQVHSAPNRVTGRTRPRNSSSYIENGTNYSSRSNHNSNSFRNTKRRRRDTYSSQYSQPDAAYSEQYIGPPAQQPIYNHHSQNYGYNNGGANYHSRYHSYSNGTQRRSGRPNRRGRGR